jgi:site-specific recombinase XerD
MGDIATRRSSVAEYLAASTSEATISAYTSDFNHFREWCGARGHEHLPAEPLVTAEYLAAMADHGFKASTIGRRAQAIAFWHRKHSLEPPTNSEGVRTLMKGIRRKIGTAQARKAPATAQMIADMVQRLPKTLTGLRDRALLLIAFAGALRRSEVVALDVEDLERTPDGVRLTIRRSKTDQEGKGQAISVPRGTKLKPQQALDEWLAASEITEGPIFRGVRGSTILRGRLQPKQVARIVKKSATALGLDPAIFAGHSLRSGFVTSALESGADVLRIMDVTRHTEIRTLKAYDRRARGFKDHAGKSFL